MTHAADGFRAGTHGEISALGLGAGQVNLISSNVLPPPGRGAFMWPIWCLSIVPLTLQAANIAASQTPAGSGNLTLTAGTGTTSGTIAGNSVILLDVARNISVTTLADEHTVSITITGYDWYSQLQTETFALPSSATKGVGKKTFLAIQSVSVNGATSAAITVGTDDTFGMVYAYSDKTLIYPKWNNTLALDTGTATVADATTATATTGDVRGTYKPSSGASDGSKRLTVLQIILNPDTKTGLLGVTPA